MCHRLNQIFSVNAEHLIARLARIGDWAENVKDGAEAELLADGADILHGHVILLREEKAQAALFKGQEYFEADLYEQALNGDSIGFAGFAKIADEYSGTKAANLAKAYMGICYAHLGQYEAAVKALDSFSGKDQMIAPAMKGAMGNCYAQLGQLDKAASMLLSAADEADNNSLSPIYLQQAGEILVKQGKYDDAIKAYTKIKDKYFRSYQSMDIDKYIEQAKLLKK